MNQPSHLLPGSYLLPAGTELFRVHKEYRKATDFNTSQAWANEREGRFDSDEDDHYSFYYAALSARGALYESLIFEANLGATDPVSQSALKDRVLSTVELVRDVLLISLRTTADFAAIGQSEWLVRAKPHEYPLTRKQTRTIRAEALWAQGLIWYSRRNPQEQSVVLFGDRCAVGTVRQKSPPSIPLDAPRTRDWLGELIEPYRIDH